MLVILLNTKIKSDVMRENFFSPSSIRFLVTLKFILFRDQISHNQEALFQQFFPSS